MKTLTQNLSGCLVTTYSQPNKSFSPQGKYDEQLKTKDRLLEENITIKEETKALMAQLEKEQGNLSVYHDKVN